MITSAEIKILGCGNAFNHVCGNTSGLLKVVDESEGEKHILIDCGYDVPQKINISTLDAVIITHTHADHAGGLEELAFRLKYQYPGKRVKLFAREAVCDHIERMLFPVLQAAMYCDNDIDEYHLNAPLRHYFDVEGVRDGYASYHATDLLGVAEMAMPKAPHSHTLPCASVSLEFQTSEGVKFVWWSGDTCKISPELRNRTYDFVFHEVQFGHNPTGKNAHVLYEDLVEEAAVTPKHGNWILTHLPEMLPDVRLGKNMAAALPGNVYKIVGQ